MVHASLFSGIGGPEVAAEMMGWRNAFHCEINPFGRAVLDYWFPESKSYEDITKTNFREWRGKIDVLTGGFPCQPFSYAGQRRGADDSRYLWPEMLRAIDEIRPAWVVGENVAGITTMVEGGILSPLGGEGSLFGDVDGVQRYGLRQSFTIERICRDLEGLGYSVQPVLIPAAACGAPHRRDRAFILAYDDNADRRDDEGGAGEDERARARQRLCERHEIRVAGVAGDVRSEIQRSAEDAFGDGCGQREYAEQGSQRDERDSRPGDDERIRAKARVPRAAASNSAGRRYRASGADGEPQGNGGEELPLADKRREQAKRLDGLSAIHGDAPNTYGEGREEPEQPGRREDSAEDGAGVHDRIERPCSNGETTDTQSERCDGSGLKQPEPCDAGESQFGRRGGENGYLLPENRWADFPTVSPVHRGNDGLPFDVDNLTISFSKWRTESIKAYGNAIVPQVMYRIFQAIQGAK